jgi:hypothetical protein
MHEEVCKLPAQVELLGHGQRLLLCISAIGVHKELRGIPNGLPGVSVGMV